MVNKNRQLTTKAVSRENRSQSNRSSGVTLKLVRIPCSFLRYSVLRSVSFRFVSFRTALHATSFHFCWAAYIRLKWFVWANTHVHQFVIYWLTMWCLFCCTAKVSIELLPWRVCACVCACLFIRVCSLSLCVAPSVRRPSLAHPFVHLSRH